MRSTSKLSPPQALLIAALAFAPLLYLGCSDSEKARTCSVNADCASGQCQADGTCATSSSSNEAGTVGPEGDGGDIPKDGSTTSDVVEPPVDSGLCVANGDGTITREEVPLRAGLKGTFKVTTSGVKVDTAGAASDAGDKRTWDFSGALTGDHSLIIETLPLAGQWFEADYPGASYYTKLSEKSDLLGIFSITTGALELKGIVSPAAGSTQTKISYDPAVSTLSFPLQKGKEWTVESTASGDIPQSFNYPYTEKYTFKVDAEGDLKTSTALNTFKVLRVSVRLKKTIGIYTYYTRQYVYVAECFGAVAKVVSDLDQVSEPPESFTDASEVQRLAP